MPSPLFLQPLLFLAPHAFFSWKPTPLPFLLLLLIQSSRDQSVRKREKHQNTNTVCSPEPSSDFVFANEEHVREEDKEEDDEEDASAAAVAAVARAFPGAGPTAGARADSSFVSVTEEETPSKAGQEVFEPPAAVGEDQRSELVGAPRLSAPNAPPSLSLPPPTLPTHARVLPPAPAPSPSLREERNEGRDEAGEQQHQQRRRQYQQEQHQQQHNDRQSRSGRSVAAATAAAGAARVAWQGAVMQEDIERNGALAGGRRVDYCLQVEKPLSRSFAVFVVYGPSSVMWCLPALPYSFS